MVNPLIVALDVATAAQAVRLARMLESEVGGFKVGLELLSGPGPATISVLGTSGVPVFADAKLHDIPATVRRAARQLGALGARWVSVHASGGRAMLEAAVEGLADGAGGRDAGVLAVTVLTSLDDEALHGVGIAASPGRLTSRMARLAAETGCEGIVCSPKELGIIATVAPDLVKVTPGIREAGAANDDQARVAAPREAMQHGADFLVVGRPIIRAVEPVLAARRILASI
ncbi:MAG: orotidine-5'-phosphate decarboxylase [Gammaproteobacteria bacterium]|nr:orotidine-5'-phosphate decarboxylase [Gammaproteobacteria bacterium]